MVSSVLGAPNFPVDQASHLREDEERLRHIAHVLGCSVETFRSGASDGSAFPEASELLGLWMAICDPAARGQILRLARALAND